MGKTTKRNSGEGSTRKLADGQWECVIQSKYLNPKTGKPKRVKRKAETEKQAVAAAKMTLSAWEKELERGRDTKIDKTKTFGKYMEEFIEEEVKPAITGSAYHSYTNTMNANFFKFPIANYQLQMLSAIEFEKHFDTILSLKSKRTCALPIQLCKRCCQWLVDRSLLKENYAAQARIKKEIIDEYDHKKEESLKNRKQVFTPEDIQKFYYAYKNNMGQYPVVVLFLLETGMRIGEFAALRLDNIDMEKGRIDIVVNRAIRYKDNDKTKGLEVYTKVPKNRSARFVMMSDLCKECVEYMIEQTKLNCTNNPDNLLYPVFRNGTTRSNESMEVCFKNLCDKLEIDRDVHITKQGNLKGLGLHSLRHTADTIANTAAGANIVNTALAMGHKTVVTENIYTHATEEALKSIQTPSQAILKDYQKKEEPEQKDKDEELYAMYLKLKEKFESTT